MGLWSRASRSHVAHMNTGDFYSNELSCIYQGNDTGSVRIELHAANDNTVHVLKESVTLVPNEVFDATYISVKALQDFYASEIQDAKENDILLSLHLKATMMKISGTWNMLLLLFALVTQKLNACIRTDFIFIAFF